MACSSRPLNTGLTAVAIRRFRGASTPLFLIFSQVGCAVWGVEPLRDDDALLIFLGCDLWDERLAVGRRPTCTYVRRRTDGRLPSTLNHGNAQTRLSYEKRP